MKIAETTVKIEKSEIRRKSHVSAKIVRTKDLIVAYYITIWSP